MRFVLHGSDNLRHLQVDWDVPVERGPELRAAMAGHDVDQMQAGTLRRGAQLDRILYPRGTIALRVADGHELFLEFPPGDEIAHVVAPPAAATTVTSTAEATGERQRIVVGDADDGERVDVVLARMISSLSRAVVRRLIDDGQVTLGGQALDKANRRLHRGDVIELVVAVPPSAAPPEPVS